MVFTACLHESVYGFYLGLLSHLAEAACDSGKGPEYNSIGKSY